MINATHFVIDLETMGKGPLAPIVAIGAVCVAKGVLVDEFYVRVSLMDWDDYGRQPDAPTIQWWLQQSDEARREIDGTQTSKTLPIALIALSDWMAAQAAREAAIVWGNGSSFDNVILRSSYEACGLPLPWHFRHDRDLRTLLALYPEAKNVGPFEGAKHHALHDARHEARQLIAALGMHCGQQSTAADTDFIQRLRDLSDQAQALGDNMKYFGGFGRAGRYSRDILCAARLASATADVLERESAP